MEWRDRESHCIFSSIILSHFGNDTRFSVIFLVKRNQVVSNCRVDQQLTFFVISPSWKNFPLPFLYLNRSDAWSQWKWNKNIAKYIFKENNFFCHFRPDLKKKRFWCLRQPIFFSVEFCNVLKIWSTVVRTDTKRYFAQGK